MIATSPGAMGEFSAKRQRLAHQDLNLSGFLPAACISGQYLGLYPKDSPLNINNGWLSKHLTAIRDDLAARKPEGPVCIDYENWLLLKDGDPESTDPDAGRYEACAAAVVRPAIGEAVRATGLAGYYDWPRFVWNAEPMPDKIKTYHDRSRWVADASTALFPVFYLPDSAKADDGWTMEAYENTLNECERLAPDKPIICLVSRNFAADPWDVMPDDVAARQVGHIMDALTGIEASSGSGLAIWESIDSPDELPAIQRYVDIVREAAKGWVSA